MPTFLKFVLLKQQNSPWTNPEYFQISRMVAAISTFSSFAMLMLAAVVLYIPAAFHAYLRLVRSRGQHAQYHRSPS